MAELREADKITLLGENYRETEMRFSEQSGGEMTPAEELRNMKGRLTKLADGRFSAVGGIFLGIVLAIASYYRANEKVDLTTLIGVGILVLAIIWYVWLRQRGRNYRTKIAGLEQSLQS